ncbi:MAG: GNAT family N-acetyltransferase [Rhizobacter sp.]
MAHAITPLLDHLRSAWFTLTRDYKTFYHTTITDVELDAAWQRLQVQDGVHDVGIERDRQLPRMTHCTFHTNTWVPTVGYLQDLFAAPQAFGQGLARALLSRPCKTPATRMNAGDMG